MRDRQTETVSYVVVLLVGTIIGLLFAHTMNKEVALSHNAAYYDQKTGEFTWKECE